MSKKKKKVDRRSMNEQAIRVRARQKILNYIDGLVDATKVKQILQ